MKIFAFIQPKTGLIDYCTQPSDHTIYTNGSIVDDRLVQTLPQGMTAKEAIAGFRWNGSNFVELPTKPNEFYSWNINDWVFDQELFLNKLKDLRNIALASTDWTQMPDSPVDSVVWAAYRQELRDLPNTLTGEERSLEDVVWPVPPSP